MPRQFLSETRNEQKKEISDSTPTETPYGIESDPTGDYLSEPLSTTFLKPTECPMSIRVPDAKESSDDEELPKQTWRAERFHMEEFLREMRVM